MKERRKHSREFKIEILTPILAGKKSLAQTSRELGIRLNTLKKWKKEYTADPEHAFPGRGNQKPKDAELARLKQEIARLEMECEILKKAQAIFSKEQAESTGSSR